MSQQNLTKEQEAFLEECLLEFSDRYTDADVEFKKIYDTAIPEPPIMHPWYGRPKLTARRHDGSSGSFRSNYRDRYENNYRDRDHHSDRDHENRRYRPY